MPLDIPVGFAHVIHSMTLTGDAEPMAVTFGIELQPDVPAFPNLLAENLHQQFGQAWATTLGNPYKLAATEIRYPLGDQGGFGLGVFVGDIPMSNAGSFLPQNSAFLVHKRTALGGRRHRGRLYLPGVNEALVDDKGLMSSTALNGVNAAALAWLNGVVSLEAVVNMVVLHTKPIGPTVIAPTPITVLTLDPVLGTQRRRLR
jgi:hypothetical protein